MYDYAMYITYAMYVAYVTKYDAYVSNQTKIATSN